jgi:hypothetical protein
MDGTVQLTVPLFAKITVRRVENVTEKREELGIAPAGS